MPYLIIQTNAICFLPIIDAIGKRGISYSWNSDNYNYLILIKGENDIDKVKGIWVWELIENGIVGYTERIEES